ncbi:NAD(P)/FAD-dependent oxidoreductase [Alkalicoccus luteus]|uniref:NAD(P)-binding protein n=1 Tax=Alkalicoccus luteus TaxID=1237094 RepID=A0A969PQD9_9BACI|nr:FAD-dependent oxidoreductase [Alkalicoccus luteus]NJP38480.1 NAD(P)-binding protein [Alkalicoccus luteus]
MQIAVAGAGLAGVFAAKTLADAGHEPILIDKGRSAGGRMATRRIGQGKADHGAQFFTVRTRTFQQEVDRWLEQGLIKKWFGDDHPRYMVPEGMNMLVKRMASAFDLHLEERIVRMEADAGGVVLAADSGSIFPADAAIVTFPPPQTAELLHRSAIPGTEEAVEELEALTFRPAIVGLQPLKQHLLIGSNGILDRDLPDGIEKMIAADQKGISTEPILSVYMTGEWSKHYFEESDEVTARAIKNALAAWNTVSTEEIQVKRWRYSEAEQTHSGAWMQAETLPLYFAGDAFLHEDDTSGKTRVESAVLSGIAAAEAVLKQHR